MSNDWGIVVAALIGGVVAYVELLARYRDDPWRAVASAPAFAYALVNGAAAALVAWWVATFFPQIVTSVSATELKSLQDAGAAVPVDNVKLAVAAGFGAL